MLKIGLTGNIGNGKTVVSHVFSTMGIPVYHADEVSKSFLSDPPVKNEIVHRFGHGILVNNQEINRVALAYLVFNDPEALKILNSILHPKIKADFRIWAEANNDQPYVIQEAAILFESGFKDEYDYTIHVSCPKETAIERVIKRDATSRTAVLNRMQFQMDNEEKSQLADFVIRNDGSELVIPQVLAIHRILSV